MVNVWGTYCGTIVGKPIMGANVEKYRETLDELLAE